VVWFAPPELSGDLDATAPRSSGFVREAVRGMDAAPGASREGFTASSRTNPDDRGAVAAAA